MNEQRYDNASSPREPTEVVLTYVAEPTPYVGCYVQPTPLPGKKAESAPTISPKRRRRGLKIFLICLAVLLALTGALAASWWFGLLPDSFYDDYYGSYYDDYDDYYGYFVPRFDASDDEVETSIPTAPTTDRVRMTYADASGEVLSIQEVYAKVNPSTVTVVAEYGNGGASVGTGVIMTEDGYILTNAHVISGAESCFVALDTGATYDALLVGFDAEQDLAVIKAVETEGRAAEGLPAAEFGNSDALNVGDTVYAIGNPLGVELRGTLTDGIVSAINRDVQVDGVSMTLIQTNAALNNGNSGGPLINEHGQVVGITVLKMASTRHSSASVEGLGFAIPIASSAYMITDLLRYGEVRGEPRMGLSIGVAPGHLPDGEEAALVHSIDLGGAADKAGVQVDDLIVEINGQRVGDSNDVLCARHPLIAGEEMHLRVYRAGAYLDLTLTLEASK